MPLQALAKTSLGFFGSTRMEKISESSIRPVETECQVGSSSVEHVLIRRVEGQSCDVLHLPVGFRRDSAPGDAAVIGDKNTLRGASGKNRGIYRRERQRFDARSMNAGQSLPGFASVLALINSGVRRIAGIQSGVVMRGCGGIDED